MKLMRPCLVSSDLDLLLPALHGILTQDVKQRVILRRGQREFQEVSD